MKRKRWALVASAAVGFVVLLAPAAGQGKAESASLGWSLSRGGPAVTSFDFGALDGAASVTRRFRLGNSSSTKSGKLAISLTGSPAFSIASDGCTAKSIGASLSCWVSVTDAPLGAGTSDSATLRATAGHGAAASLSLSGSCTGPACQPSPVSWGSAIEVPGSAALNVGGYAGVTSVSCPSAGECAAGGYYGDGSGTYGAGTQAFVVSEQGGTWGTAIEVPGMAALGGLARVTSVSCASAGNCAAGGYYDDGHSGWQAFVVSEQGGVWGSALEVPGLATLNGGGYAQVASVSCASPGNCTAGGFYSTGKTNLVNSAFVVSETNGTWGTAFDPGGRAGRSDLDATVTSVSCGGPRDCVAGGWYVNSARATHAFVAVERNGTWGHRMSVPGMAALSGRGLSRVTAVSCAGLGDCVAGGEYSHGPRRPPYGYYAFVVEEKNGTWGHVRKVPGAGLGNVGSVMSVACATAGECAVGMAAGQFDKFGDGSGQALVASEKNGRWGAAIEVPGLAALNAGEDAWVTSVSCATPGNCAAAGFYTDSSYYQVHAFVVAERSGVWGTAVDVPGTGIAGSIYVGNSISISCARAGNCAIGGSDDYSAGHTRAVVTAP